MFHARIVSPQGSLYLAAEATPYDLENLRTYVYDLRSTGGGRVRLELRFDGKDPSATRKRVTSLVEALLADGVQVDLRPRRRAVGV
jgi:hypothetical protein